MFPGGETSTFCLSFSGCSHCNVRGRSQSTSLFLHHKQNAPWKHALYLHLFWNVFQVELYTSLPQRCNFCHPLQLFFWIGAYMSLSLWTPHNWCLKCTWTINNYVCGSLVSLCWLDRIHFWNLVSELFSTLRLSEILFLFINCLISILRALSTNGLMLSHI